MSNIVMGRLVEGIRDFESKREGTFARTKGGVGARGIADSFKAIWGTGKSHVNCTSCWITRSYIHHI